jgi:hypothetical protein
MSWFIEFEETPKDLAGFAEQVNENLRTKNIYYDDLIRGNILQKTGDSTPPEKCIYRLYEVCR